MDLQENISRHFNIRIAEKNLKQKDIAKSIGITEDRLSRILSLKSKMTVDEFLRLCSVLEVNVNVFIQYSTV